MINSDCLQKELELKLEQVLTSRSITGRELQQNFRDPKVLVQSRFNMDAMMVTLYDYIWKEELETIIKEERFYTPANCWQHFKKDYFPKWALKKWPVINKTEIVTLRCEAKAYYPTIQNLTGHKGVIKLHEIPKYSYEEE